MNLQLTPLEARVIGSLVEKATTTPDQYPLSLNALTNACNQKSNRDPLMSLDERTVQETLDGLASKHLVLERSGFGSRVPKYQHRFCNTGFGSLEFSAPEVAILCELLLRGPQTPGELRTLASRMAAISDVGEAEAALERLAAREDGPFVVRLAREPGKREARYAHLFCGPIEAAAEPSGRSARRGTLPGGVRSLYRSRLPVPGGRQPDHQLPLTPVVPAIPGLGPGRPGKHPGCVCQAIEMGYRFYSYGDAMAISPDPAEIPSACDILDFDCCKNGCIITY